jgi:hypothetical protein
MSEIRFNNGKEEFVDGLISQKEILVKKLSSAPSSTASYAHLYAKSDGNIYHQNSSGSETQVGLTSSGTGLTKGYIASSKPVLTTANSISIDNFTALDSTNSQMIDFSSSTASPATFYNWDFNEGTGTTINSNLATSATALTTGGTVTWGSGYLSVNGTAGNNFFAGANGLLSQIDSFSIALWFEWNGTSTNNWFLAIGDGAGTANSNLSFGLTRQDSGGMGASVNSGSSGTIVTTGVQPVNGVKYFGIATYTRVGGSNNNILTFRFTSDGINWFSASTNTAVLMQQNSAHELRSSIINNFTNSTNCKYYRLTVYPERILTNNEMQSLYNIGSEGSITSTITNTLKGQTLNLGNPVPTEWLFNEGSGTTMADTKGNGGFSITAGAATWGTGWVEVNGYGGNKMETAAGIYHGLNTFSIAAWVEPVNIVSSSTPRAFLCLGDESISAGNLSFGMMCVNGVVEFRISNGSSYTQLTSNHIPVNGTKYLFVATYERVGGTGNNKAKFRFTSDGITWYELTSSSAVLMQQNSTHKLRNGWEFATGTADVKWHRLGLYNDKILTNDEIQAIWDSGSEAAASSSVYSQVNTINYSSALSGTVSYSSTTVTGTGTSFTTDFKVGDVIFSKEYGRKITAIASNTSMTIDSAMPASYAGVTYKRGGYAPNTWYYVYSIFNGTTSNLWASTRNLSAGDTLVDLPSGYTYYRQTALALKTTSSGRILPFRVTGDWPKHPTIIYNGTFNVNGALTTTVANAFTTTTFTPVDCSSFVPAISTNPIFYYSATGSGGPAITTRPSGNHTVGVTTVTLPESGYGDTFVAHCNSSQKIDLKTSAITIYLSVYGYTVTSEI